MGGIPHHHAGGRVHPAVPEPVFAHLHLAHAVNVLKTEQLGKIVLKTPRAYLLDQVIAAGGGKHSLLPAPALELCQRGGGVCHGRAMPLDSGVIVLHKPGSQLRVGVSGKIKPGAEVIFLNGETKDLPVFGKVIPLGVAMRFQHPVQAPVGEIHIVQQGPVPVPEDDSVWLHGFLLL